MSLPDDAFLFWRGPFSNFAPSPITLDCPHSHVPRTYATVEHYFQACKATSLEDHLQVANASDAKAAKRAGRVVRLRDDWEEIKYDVMVTALREKFAAEPYRSKLLRTGASFIAEDSPYDFEWGVRDRDGGYNGQNLLGRALMQVRTELQEAGLAPETQLTLAVD